MNDIKEIMASGLILDIKLTRNVYQTVEDEKIAAAQYQLDKLKVAGFVIVPIEPNNAMISAGMWASESGYKFYEVYAKMIQASQGGDV